MFSLVSSRYERASMIVTSNKPFSAWGEIFGDDMAATAMIDRLIHHAEILSLKGDSYRLRGKDLDARPPPRPDPPDPSPAERLRASTDSGTGPRRRHFAPLAYGSLPKKPPHPNPQVAHFSTGASGPLFDRP